MIANRKRGMVIPRNETTPKSVSTQLYWRVAATIPNVMPMTDARMWQVRASRSVRPSRSPTIVLTGLL
jgi:hypothetical protein